MFLPSFREATRLVLVDDIAHVAGRAQATVAQAPAGSQADSLAAADLHQSAAQAASTDPCAVAASGPQKGPNGAPNLSSTGLAVGGALIAIAALLAAGGAALFVRYRALGRRR
ncbi:hypothetical protein [Subtercola endophyticus]|uniref:hypothetical protein n=1 Tax=Subtercola endophyticus TaxID=2895559 RepID=UPI001E3383A1|nr:hypothetical protein [Subtercola endophyticus]UFS59191.1 hypothetical protein LQ955_19815 [Subtercola endophyticus]